MKNKDQKIRVSESLEPSHKEIKSFVDVLAGLKPEDHPGLQSHLRAKDFSEDPTHYEQDVILVFDGGRFIHSSSAILPGNSINDMTILSYSQILIILKRQLHGVYSPGMGVENAC